MRRHRKYPAKIKTEMRMLWPLSSGLLVGYLDRDTIWDIGLPPYACIRYATWIIPAFKSQNISLQNRHALSPVSTHASKHVMNHSLHISSDCFIWNSHFSTHTSKHVMSHSLHISSDCFIWNSHFSTHTSKHVMSHSLHISSDCFIWNSPFSLSTPMNTLCRSKNSTMCHRALLQSTGPLLACVCQCIA